MRGMYSYRTIILPSKLLRKSNNMKTIPNHPNYTITKDGQVWSKPCKDACNRLRGGQWLTPCDGGKGYLFVRLGSKCPSQPVHRLMLETFVGFRPLGLQCRHLDGDKQNNRLDNLCWGTPKENQQDRILNGTDLRGKKHPMVKLLEEQVRVIFHAYHDGYYTQREIAKAFGIAQTEVSAIARKQIWFHLWN